MYAKCGKVRVICKIFNGLWSGLKLFIFISRPQKFAPFGTLLYIVEAAMTSTPKRQKTRDGSYTPTSTADVSDSNLKRKGQQQPFQHSNDPDDPLLAAYNNPYLAHMLPDQGYVPQVAAGKGPLRDFKRRQTYCQRGRESRGWT